MFEFNMTREGTSESCTLRVEAKGRLVGTFLACPAYGGPDPYLIPQQTTATERVAVAAAFAWARNLDTDCQLPACARADWCGGAVLGDDGQVYLAADVADAIASAK